MREIEKKGFIKMVLYTIIIISFCVASFKIGRFLIRRSMIVPGYTNEYSRRWSSSGYNQPNLYSRFDYDSAEKIANNRRYRLATENDTAEIEGYFDHFITWEKEEFSGSHLVDFDTGCINAGDYFRIKESGEKYKKYEVWFFDSETTTLYYIKYRKTNVLHA